MVDHIRHEGELLAIVLRADHRGEGIEFFTPQEYSQQMAYMNRPKGYVIPSHEHLPVPRQVQHTLEALFIRRGRVRADFYHERQLVSSIELVQGDVALLVSGGHGFTMLEDSEMVEIKQGPYAGTLDKRCFEPGQSCPPCEGGS